MKQKKGETETDADGRYNRAIYVAENGAKGEWTKQDTG